MSSDILQMKLNALHRELENARKQIQDLKKWALEDKREIERLEILLDIKNNFSVSKNSTKDK